MYFSFRKATLLDTEKIVDLVNSAYRGESSKKGWTTEADLLGGQRTDSREIQEFVQTPNSQMILCESKSNELLGCVLLKKNGHRCYFGMFAVKPTTQGQGLGKSFIAYSEEFARKELDCNQMYMTVITLREELIAWYERRGYKRTGEIEKFPYGNERAGIPRRDNIELEVLVKELR